LRKFYDVYPWTFKRLTYLALSSYRRGVVVAVVAEVEEVEAAAEEVEVVVEEVEVAAAVKVAAAEVAAAGQKVGCIPEVVVDHTEVRQEADTEAHPAVAEVEAHPAVAEGIPAAADQTKVGNTVVARLKEVGPCLEKPITTQRYRKPAYGQRQNHREAMFKS
jgi:hypothetical protein